MERTRTTDQVELVNEARLVGTVTRRPEARTMPSGDEVVTLRVSVPRGDRALGRTSSGAPGTDSVPCIVWAGRARRSVLTWRPGDVVEVTGPVRVRFFHAGGSTQSRIEVEVTSARVMRRATAS
ncbi:single-stranded DNA-binding protein [Nocardioides sp. J2M5]|uniref:single-stranded DNA-binding protein n=1 Tax=Nocardioides palaemonis TaxID=2829810 RepID=UPI001BAB4570|nr:single-stranded DNA-binding protein [Nocardioides palaemonis]MBS2937916.1 single-stranded DNA-binding protein [Nocardioides palaemonis]